MEILNPTLSATVLIFYSAPFPPSEEDTPALHSYSLTMLQKILFCALACLMFSQFRVAAQERPLLLFNNTFFIPTSESKLAASADVPCFPALGFKMPANVPSSLDGWWCDSSVEYAFVGFSYEITQCKFGPSPLLVSG